MEDPEDRASLLETTPFDSGQVVCPFQKVHGRLEDQGGLVDDLLSQMWKITQLCQKGAGGLVDDMLEPIDSGQKDLRWLLSQQTCGIPDVQEFLPSTTCVWGQDSYPDQKVHGGLEDWVDKEQLLSSTTLALNFSLPCTTWSMGQKYCPGQRVDEGLSPQQLPHWPQQLRQRQLLPLELPATFDIGQKDDKVPGQLKKKGSEGRQFLVNENPDLDWTPTFNLKAPLRELLARDLSTAMVVITGATLLRSYDLENLETAMVAGCKKVLGGRATISTTETTRNEITKNEMKANLLRHISMLTTSAVLAAIFLSGTHRLSGTHSLKAQSGIDFNHRMTERTRENDHLKGSFTEVAV
jgi:hypothetical protein